MDVNEIGVPANYLKGLEGIGGSLFLKDDEIYFQPHKFNIHKSELHIAFKEIRAVETHKTLGIIDNQFIVYTKDDKQYKFIAYYPKRIAEYIRSNICS